MEKLKRTEFYICLLLSSLALGALGCGSAKKSKPDQTVIDPKAEETSKKALDEDASGKSKKSGDSPQQSPVQNQESPNQSPSPDAKYQDTQKPAAQPLEGTFVQVDNQQARVVISPDLLLTTNLEFPSPSGNGTRLTPSFPQGLRYFQPTDEYRTIGTYNDGTGVFKNIEIRVRLYGQNKLLDVSLITSPVIQNTLTETTGGSTAGDGDGIALTQVVSFCLPFPLLSCPLPPAPPPPPPLPPPTNCPNPCPPSNQMKYVYRFVRA